jgi:hypothetical protein
MRAMTSVQPRQPRDVKTDLDADRAKEISATLADKGLAAVRIALGHTWSTTENERRASRPDPTARRVSRPTR